jgi:menaquinone-dependent protoporphyrinogen oxidase
MARMTRRAFVRDAVRLTGGAICTLSSGSALFLPVKAWASKSVFTESTCGDKDTQSRRVLVAYASMHGSTGKVAQTIGKTICGYGAAADIRLITNVNTLTLYDAVIVGSAVRTDKWLAEAIHFVEINRKALSQVPVAYFLTCLTLARPSEENLRRARSYMDPILDGVSEVKPVNMGLFAGVLDYSKYSAGMGAVMRYKMWSKGVEEGDYRDWDAIKSWAGRVASSIAGAGVKS